MCFLTPDVDEGSFLGAEGAQYLPSTVSIQSRAMALRDTQDPEKTLKNMGNLPSWNSEPTALAPPMPPMQAPIYYMPTPSTPTKTSFKDFQMHLVFAISATFLVMLILWKKNPTFIQEHFTNNIDNSEANLVGPPSTIKIVVVGVVVFAFLMLGSPLWKGPSSTEIS